MDTLQQADVVVRRSSPEAGALLAPGAGGRLLRMVLGVPLFWKLALGNAVVVGLGGLGALLLVGRATSGATTAPLIPLLLVLSVLAAVILVNAGLARIALWPLDLLEETAARVGEGDLSVRVADTPLADEGTRRLAGVLNAMIRSLEDSRFQEREGARRLLALVERDRERVSHSLYQGVAQTLAGLLVRLGTAGSSETEMLPSLTEEIRQLIEDVRKLARELRPPELDELGLRPALEAYVRSVTSGSDLAVTLEGGLDEDRLTPAARLEVYRMVEETIAYAVISGSGGVHVRFDPGPTALVTHVRVDGGGGERRREEGGAELLGIQARALQVGGEVELGPWGPRDLQVRLSLPWVAAP